MSPALETWSHNGPGPSGAGYGQLESLLVEGESVSAVALQHRLYALLHRRRLAAATSGRLIVMDRSLLGGFRPRSIRWQDLREVELEVGPISARLSIAFSGNLSDTASGEAETRWLTVAGLEKEGGQALYRACQSQEQSWREKRRVRALEEMRAESGGVQIAAGVYPPSAERPYRAIDVTPAEASESPAERLARARRMLSAGLISDAEFEAVKARSVGSL
ncbi:MAG: hypothetical protein ACRED8_01435 [Caulobacteraceae bacterium]